MWLTSSLGKEDFKKAAQLCPKVFGQDAHLWEDMIFAYAQRNELQVPISLPLPLSETYINQNIIDHYTLYTD